MSNVLAEKSHVCFAELLIEVRYDVKPVDQLQGDGIEQNEARGDPE